MPNPFMLLMGFETRVTRLKLSVRLAPSAYSVPEREPSNSVRIFLSETP